MNKNIYKIIIGLLLFLFLKAYNARAQQDPMYSQYMFNIQAFNPAYAGSWDRLGLTILTREQWIGFNNNPSTQTISIQAPLYNNKVGAGLSLINDQTGSLRRMGFFMDYSYGIKLNKKTTLRLGLKAGITNYQNNYSSVVLVNPEDPAFSMEPVSLLLPNFGVGAFLHAQKFYLGFSVPKLMQNENDKAINVIEMRYLTAIGGLVINVAKGIDIKPSFNVRYHTDGPLVADANLSFLFANKFWIGATYRTTNDLDLGVNANFIIGKNMRIGYAYDTSRNSGLSSIGSGTHEIMLSYEFQFKQTRFTSPRYF